MKWREFGDNPKQSGNYICEVKIIDGGMSFWPVSYQRFDGYNWTEPLHVGKKCEIVKWLDEDVDGSAIQLIKDIAHLNYYGEVSDFANRWLIENGYEKL